MSPSFPGNTLPGDGFDARAYADLSEEERERVMEQITGVKIGFKWLLHTRATQGRFVTEEELEEHRVPRSRWAEFIPVLVEETEAALSFTSDDQYLGGHTIKIS